jgi:hypothetical protein
VAHLVVAAEREGNADGDGGAQAKVQRHSGDLHVTHSLTHSHTLTHTQTGLLDY